MNFWRGIVIGAAMGRTALLLLCAFAAAPVRGQDKFEDERYPSMDCVLPLDGPLALSGSFGEVRANHFHGGTDLRTGGEEGHPVYAVAGGSVVRVSVATGGYGKALYVLHPNGVTSVYAHLQRFNPEIEAWVRAQQYQRARYEVQLFPPPGRFNVQRGDTLALSGNTGSSGGPHLHFELRLQHGSVPYNSYLSGIRHQDSLPPQFTHFYLYEIDATNYGRSLEMRKRFYFTGREGEYRLNVDTLEVGSFVGFGVEAKDPVNAISFPCSLNGLKMRVNGELVYNFNMQRVSFDETQYANAHVDSYLRAHEGRRVMFLFTLPGNALSRYQTERGGYLSLGRGESANVEIEAVDMAGNRSFLRFVARGTGLPVSYPADSALAVLPWRTGCVVQRRRFRLEVPAKALYYDVALRAVERDTLRRDGMPGAVSFGNAHVPMHRALMLWFDGSKVPVAKRKMCYMAWLDAKEHAHYVGGLQWDGNWAGCGVRSFSTFTVRIDSVPPVIDAKPLAQVCGRDLRKAETLAIRAIDAHTTIKRVDAYIDGRWILLEWEPKLSRGVYRFDDRCEVRGVSHLLKVVAEDAVGNVSTHECSFTR